MKEIRKDLWEMKYLQGISRIDYCPKNEQKELKEKKRNKLLLPDDVLEDECGDFYRYVDEELTEREIRELLECRKIDMLNRQLKAFSLMKIASIVIAVAFVFLSITIALNFIFGQLMFWF